VARNPFRVATALGSVLQVGMVLLGLAFPVLQQGNLYPIGGTCLALLTGFLFARWLSGRALPPALLGGAFAGGFSSFLGTAVAALTGQAAPAPVITVLVATVTGFVAGSVGGFFGMLFGGPRLAA
jgi:uncharacterized membrane protein YjjP (DUF1212 family)